MFCLKFLFDSLTSVSWTIFKQLNRWQIFLFSYFLFTVQVTHLLLILLTSDIPSLNLHEMNITLWSYFNFYITEHFYEISDWKTNVIFQYKGSHSIIYCHSIKHQLCEAAKRTVCKWIDCLLTIFVCGRGCFAKTCSKIHEGLGYLSCQPFFRTITDGYEWVLLALHVFIPMVFRNLQLLRSIFRNLSFLFRNILF